MLSSEFAADTAKDLVHQLLDAHQHNDVDRVCELLSPDLVWHIGSSPTALGREDWLKGMREGARAFSDLKIHPVEPIAEGSMVAVLFVAEGRHTGEFEGVAPTNERFRFASMWMLRIDNDKVAQVWLLDEDIRSKLRHAARAA